MKSFIEVADDNDLEERSCKFVQDNEKAMVNMPSTFSKFQREVDQLKYPF